MEPLTQTERKWGEALAAEPGPACLEAEALIAIAAKGRRAPQADAHMAHLAACPTCRKALKELRAVEVLKPAIPSRKFEWPRLAPYAAGIAAASVLFTFAVWVFSGLGSGNGGTATIAREQPAPTPIPTPMPSTVLPPAPKVAAPEETKPDSAKGTLAKRPRFRIRRAATSTERIDPPAPIAERSIETYDANSGWSREDVTGEVLGGNIATGEVTSPNQVQGEVGRAGPPPDKDVQRI